MPKLDPVELRRLIGVVEAKLVAIPPIKVGEMGSYSAHRTAAEIACAELGRDEGAKYKSAHDAFRLSLGGIVTSCTGGAAGALRNWLAAARRRLEAEASHA